MEKDSEGPCVGDFHQLGLRLCCAQSCLTLWSPDPSAHGTAQARILGWVVISSSKGSSCPRDGTLVSCAPAWQVDSSPTEPLRSQLDMKLEHKLSTYIPLVETQSQDFIQLQENQTWSVAVWGEKEMILCNIVSSVYLFFNGTLAYLFIFLFFYCSGFCHILLNIQKGGPVYTALHSYQICHRRG